MKTYVSNNLFRLCAVALVVIGLFFGMIDPVAAMGGCILLETAPADEILKKALQEHSVAMTTWAKKFTDGLEKSSQKMAEQGQRLTDLEQKLSQRPSPGAGNLGLDGTKQLADLVSSDDGVARFVKGNRAPTEIVVPHQLVKTAIVNAQGASQPLVQADRRQGIVIAPQRRLTIRQLFEQVPTASNVIEFPKEESFTNNAAQVFSSPDSVENVTKPESGATFSLGSVNLVTIAHWIPASRQVLSDAPALQRYLDARLMYGLKLKEEQLFLLGDGSTGSMAGLSLNATAFNRGGTHQTPIDALCQALLQLILSDYEPSGVILNPADWFNIMLLKDDEGRYIFGDPHSMVEPRLWGLPVVATNSMTSGQFMVLDAARTGYVADREDASIRISESHDDFFVRNMVAILCEERTTLVIERAGAVVKGALPTEYA